MFLGLNIMFSGNCKEAVSFYCKVFDKELPALITYGEGNTSFDPNVQLSDSGKNLIMNASMNIYGTNIAFNDMPDNFEFVQGNSFGITLNFDSTKEASEIFEKLSEGGLVFVPFAKLENQNYYGMFADKFNIVWTVIA